MSQEPGGVPQELGGVSKELGGVPKEPGGVPQEPDQELGGASETKGPLTLRRAGSNGRARHKEIRTKIAQERKRRDQYRRESIHATRQALRVNIAQQPVIRSSHRQHRRQALMAIRAKHAQAQLARGVQTGGDRAFNLFKHTLAYKVAMKLKWLCGQLGGTCREEHSIVSMIAPPQAEEALTPAQTIQVSLPFAPALPQSYPRVHPLTHPSLSLHATHQTISSLTPILSPDAHLRSSGMCSSSSFSSSA